MEIHVLQIVPECTNNRRDAQTLRHPQNWHGLEHSTNITDARIQAYLAIAQAIVEARRLGVGSHVCGRERDHSCD